MSPVPFQCYRCGCFFCGRNPRCYPPQSGPGRRSGLGTRGRFVLDGGKPRMEFVAGRPAERACTTGQKLQVQEQDGEGGGQSGAAPAGCA